MARHLRFLKCGCVVGLVPCPEARKLIEHIKKLQGIKGAATEVNLIKATSRLQRHIKENELQTFEVYEGGKNEKKVSGF